MAAFYGLFMKDALKAFPLLFKPFRYPDWIPAAVEYGSDPSNTILNAVVHCVRKTLGKKAMIAKDLDPHLSRCRTAFLASAISRKCDVPSAILCSRARRTSACQDGEGISSGVPAARSAQISSIACSLSSTLIFSNGMDKCMITLQLCSSDQRLDNHCQLLCFIPCLVKAFYAKFSIN